MVFGTSLAVANITTYPRKGTKTQQVQDLQVRQVQITTYPRKGTETVFAANLDIYIIITTYPRKGTETQLQRQSSSP